MYIYNVTVSVDNSVEEDWIKWMKEIHIPEVMNTGFFKSQKMCKVLLQTQENASTYSIQYSFEQMKDLQLYQAKEAPALQAKHVERYGDLCTAFRTVLEELN